MLEKQLYVNSLALNVKRLREAAGNSVDELADMCGISRRSWYRYEDPDSGLSIPGYCIPMLSSIFSKTADEICGLEFPLPRDDKAGMVMAYYEKLEPEQRDMLVWLARWAFTNKSSKGLPALVEFLKLANPVR